MPHSFLSAGPSTIAVHVGSEHNAETSAVIPPISLSTTFAQSAPGVHKGYEYSRSKNPSRDAFERVIAALEGGKHGFAFSSGSSSTATLLALVDAGSHVISVNDLYGGTNRYLSKVVPRISNVKVSFVDLLDPAEIKKHLKENTKMVWLETPTNPTLRLVDIKALEAIVHNFNSEIILVVDNTFMTPYLQKPLELGADIVTHSVTKYINGHCDVVMGAAVTSCPKLAERISFLQNSIGAVPSAFDCYLAQRGVKTLALRMERHCANALKVAQFLEKHPKVFKVYYPGLLSHPQHDLAVRQQRNFGGMVSFVIKDADVSTSGVFLSSLEVFTLAESLGGVESLAELPAVMTHASVKPEDRQILGITDGFIRLSVGIEDDFDLIKDLEQALGRI